MWPRHARARARRRARARAPPPPAAAAVMATVTTGAVVDTLLLPPLLLLMLSQHQSSVGGAASPPCQGICPNDPATIATDCAVKKLLLSAARSLQPGHDDPREIFDALQLAEQCSVPPPPPMPCRGFRISGSHSGNTWVPPPHAIVVRPGDSLPYALARAAALPAGQRMLVLEDGTHYLNKTLRIGPENSHTVIRAAPHTRPVISGGQLLRVGSWQPAKVPSGAPGVLSTSLRGQQVASRTLPLRALFVDGRRAIRARMPDADPEIEGLHTAHTGDNKTGWFGGARGWLPPPSSLAGNATIVNISSPNRNRPEGGSPIFAFFLQGEGGPVSQFVPSRSYWGWTRPGNPTNPKPAGGGGQTYTIPGGLRFGNGSVAGSSAGGWLLNRSWADPASGEVHAFHSGHWGSWVFQLTARADETEETAVRAGFGGNLTWVRGGFQEARGSPHGAEWHVEGVMELLDSAREFHFDPETETLYYKPNITDAPMHTQATAVHDEVHEATAAAMALKLAPTQVVAAQLEEVLVIGGVSAAAPTVGVTLDGITISHSRPTYLDDYEVVSGGVREHWSPRSTDKNAPPI
jgi:hypothetical protein